MVRRDHWQITGSGTWYQHRRETTVWDTDEDGKSHMRTEVHYDSDCKTRGFRYKFNVFNTPMVIQYKKEGGGFFKSSKLHFTAANAFAPDVPLFTVSSDGESNASVQTFPNSDPVSTILAAYAIACKLDPDEFGQGAERQCSRHIHLGMPPGMSNFVGMDEAAFEHAFSYPAPVPQVFAAQVASFVPVAGPPMTVAQPVMAQPGMAMAQPGMAMAQPGMAMAQPVMAQPGMAMAQPGMAMAQPGMAMAQPVMAQPGYDQNFPTAQVMPQ